ncbi:AI-2E family transporter [Novipirellula artificiosorum]|uniref:AI-2 transport protein TqsA n=1 Tax=Novipirellula artificiosorum TaxID=2528016 RepID=A0A5C6CGR8_9BACT|nr:AI-2E family transporter [Novipirellula artificiosorum]TWU23850.1 AI-2 transport protein TqsA [Novipirellula artificiosorum]
MRKLKSDIATISAIAQMLAVVLTVTALFFARDVFVPLSLGLLLSFLLSPLAIALSVFPGYSVALAVLALIVTMELLSNNILEPWLYGASTGISAVAVIIAAVFWGWMWGPVGLLLSTPLTVCLVVLGRYVPRFKILATLLSEEVEIETSLRFYQRLLAADEHRSWEMLREAFDEEHNLVATGDEVLIPALKRIRRDHNAEYLSDADANRLYAMVGGLIAKLREHATDNQHA